MKDCTGRTGQPFGAQKRRPTAPSILSPPDTSNVPVRPHSLGDDKGALGAAWPSTLRWLLRKDSGSAGALAGPAQVTRPASAFGISTVGVDAPPEPKGNSEPIVNRGRVADDAKRLEIGDEHVCGGGRIETRFHARPRQLHHVVAGCVVRQVAPAQEPGLHGRESAVRVVEVNGPSVPLVGLAEEGGGRGQDAETDCEAED